MSFLAITWKFSSKPGHKRAIAWFSTIAPMKQTPYTRAQQLPALLAQRILILDGAMGTMIQRFRLNEAQ